jgi:hypothetical protein
MLKLLKLSAALSAAAVIVSLPQTVFSRPLPESSGYPVVQNSARGSLFCYMRTQRGATLNLENLCRADDRSSSGNTVTNVPSNPAAPSTPAATTNPQRRVYTFIGTPGGNTNPNGANTGTNGNPNGANTNANTNLNGANTNANTNLNGTNTNVNTNSSGLNSNANSSVNGTNTNANTNPGGLNTSTNNPR